MTFEALYSFLKNKETQSKTDLLIVEKILEAERDWTKPLNNLSEFIIALEAEIGGETSKNNLIKLLGSYQINGFENSPWKTESVTILLEIFELTQENNLNIIFEDLSNRIRKN